MRRLLNRLLGRLHSGLRDDIGCGVVHPEWFTYWLHAADSATHKRHHTIMIVPAKGRKDWWVGIRDSEDEWTPHPRMYEYVHQPIGDDQIVPYIRFLGIRFRDITMERHRSLSCSDRFWDDVVNGHWEWLVDANRSTQISRVYFIRNTVTGLIKIGYAIRPLRRLGDLQVAAGARFELLKTIPGGREREQTLHKLFAPSRVMGEWFNPDANLLQFIEDIDQEAIEDFAVDFLSPTYEGGRDAFIKSLPIAQQHNVRM